MDRAIVRRTAHEGIGNGITGKLEGPRDGASGLSRGARTDQKRCRNTDSALTTSPTRRQLWLSARRAVSIDRVFGVCAFPGILLIGNQARDDVPSRRKFPGRRTLQTVANPGGSNTHAILPIACPDSAHCGWKLGRILAEAASKTVIAVNAKQPTPPVMITVANTTNTAARVAVVGLSSSRPFSHQGRCRCGRSATCSRTEVFHHRAPRRAAWPLTVRRGLTL